MNFLCRCMCIVQPEKETLEEKPFILPTDSPVSAPTFWYIDRVRGPSGLCTTKCDYVGVPETLAF